MNDNQSLTDFQTEPRRPRPRAWNSLLGSRRGVLLCVLLLGILAIYPTWWWLRKLPEAEDPPVTPEVLAADRKRMEAFLAAHDYEAFLRVMERQPRAVRAELPAEWLRRYDEIKPALLFTVREATTEEVINSEEKYEAPLLLLRWSKDGNYLVNILEPKRNVFDGRTGRLVSAAHEPTRLSSTDAHWPLGQWDSTGKRTENHVLPLSEMLVKRLCLSFGQEPDYWQSKPNQRVVLLMPSEDETRMLTGYAVWPEDVWKAPTGGGLGFGGRPQDRHGPARHLHGSMFPASILRIEESRRCFNVWKANAFPR